MGLHVNLIDQIDFLNHDGVNRNMINDFMRNQFYDRIFAENLKDQHCVDIGFGTGLLSVLAIKHGAKSIVAYESDPARYELGKQVINDLGYKQITLLHDRFNYSMLDQHQGAIFTETVNGNLWQEGLFNSLPRTTGINFLPGQYYLEIYACVVPDVFAQGLINPIATTGFSPGIDLDDNFVDYINKIGFSSPGRSRNTVASTWAIIDPEKDTEWGWIPYMRLCEHNGKLVAGYCLNANTGSISLINGHQISIDFDCQHLQLTVDTDSWKDCSVILVPRVGMRHSNFQLVLDSGHWGAAQSPMVLTRPTGRVTITHNFYSGHLKFDVDTGCL
jgi:hypothetical protein